MAGSRWIAAWAGAAATAAVLVGSTASLAIWRIGPYFLDDRALDGAVRVAALTWAAADRGAAEEQLRFEMDDAGVGPHVPDDACEFFDDGEARTIRCRWAVTVVVPATEWAIPLDFESHVALDAEGRLR